MSDISVDTRPLRATPLLTGKDTMWLGLVYRRPRGLDDHLLVLTLEGRGEIGSAVGERFIQQPGDLMLIEPYQPIDQDVRHDSGWRRLWIIFSPRPHWYEWLDWPRVAPGYGLLQVPLHGGAQALIHEQLEAAHQYAMGTQPYRHDLAMNALEAALLWCNIQNPQGSHTKLDARVAAATEFVCQHLHERLTLKSVAEAAGLSVPHLVRMFRHAFDVSPMQFVERRRLQRAGELLQMTSQTIGEIAAGVGYEDPFHFSTRFKRYTGQSPRAYRRAAAESGAVRPA